MTRTTAHALRRTALVLAALATGGLLTPAPASAAFARSSTTVRTSARTAEPCTARALTGERGSSWAAPLDRIVSIRLEDGSLREALDRLSSLARVELSYSAELLPTDRRVCLSLERVPVGAVLETLLAGTGLRPIVTGAQGVVLAPSRALPVAAAPVSRRASLLDRVVVTGTPDGGSQRGSPFALDVIDGVALSRTNSGTLGDALELAVPGVWTWTNTAGTVTARFGSVRGASSFGVTTPKLYLDGIEVTNPLLVTQLDASRVDRIEIIRGPQGAALYGADAISGVVNVLTRHDGSPSRAPFVQFTTSGGVAASDYTASNVYVQDHALTVRTGSGARTAGLGVSLSTVGAYVPGASEQRLLADGDTRLVLGRSVLTGTARFSLQRAGASSGLLFGPALPGENRVGTSSGMSGVAAAVDEGLVSRDPGDSVRVAGDSAAGQRVAQYTVGATLTVMPSLRWTNTIIAGVDGYRLDGVSAAGLPAPVTRAGDPGSSDGAATRGSLRLRSVGRFDVGEQTVFALTLGAEHATTRDATAPVRQLVTTRPDPLADAQRVGSGPPPVGRPREERRENLPAGLPTGAPQLTIYPVDSTRVSTTVGWTNNSGVLAQGQLAWRDALFLAAGGRFERTGGATPNAQYAWLPMLGATYVHEVPGAVLKTRAAFGKGIRPAQALARDATWIGRTTPWRAATLEPEAQTGTEFGVDVIANRGVQLHLTRFDQRASGLIQPVTVVTGTVQNGRPVRLVGYRLENVGAIDNAGWEVQGNMSIASLRLGVAYTAVESRVARVAPGYGGELRAGDRMLDVPARTLGATAAWVAARWTLSGTLARAEDWISYDRIAIGSAVATPTAAPLTPASLREYWRRYDAVTRARASLSWRLSRAVSLEAVGENLLNVQRGVPDNGSIIAGRTLSLGVRTTFQ